MAVGPRSGDDPAITELLNIEPTRRQHRDPRPAAAASGCADPCVDRESQAWLDRLGPASPDREAGIKMLHALLLRAARFEVNRRRASASHLRGDDHDDLAQQSADDALIAVLAKLGEFRGESRFTTWAHKFALLEASTQIRRRAWQGREIPLKPESWDVFADAGSSPDRDLEMKELFAALNHAIKTDLSPHQREVLVAVTLNGVPVDVIAERLHTTRGALYKTIHDARRKLRAALSAQNLGATAPRFSSHKRSPCEPTP